MGVPGGARHINMAFLKESDLDDQLLLQTRAFLSDIHILTTPTLDRPPSPQTPFLLHNWLLLLMEAQGKNVQKLVV